MPYSQQLYRQICGDIQAREAWLSRQSVWYAMRHDGVRRQNKPWPGAADLHYPLADSIIEKLKPFYFQQLFGTETLAQLIPRRPELQPQAGEAQAWFDYQLKFRSNLEQEILLAVDKMLMAGHAPMKVYWDADRHRLAFDAIEPQHCLVPESTQALEEADRVTLVHHLSVEQYLRDPRFVAKGEELVRRISGLGEVSAADSALTEGRRLREGLTHGAAGQSMIIVWEVWEHSEEGWWVHWISPLAPEEPLRPSQRNPFTHGQLPLVRFDAEIKDKGHYAARGVPERTGAFEAALCKYWNEKSDYMTLCNRPLFTSSVPIPNAANLRLLPGQIIPGGLEAVKMPPPPLSFDQEMTSTRVVAEYNVGVPDFAVGQPGTSSGHRTATEVDRVSTLLNVSVDMRARTFRMGLNALLRLAWATLRQYEAGGEYLAGGEWRRLAAGAEALRAEEWMVQANGSTDSWNRRAQLERAMLRKKLFAGSPWIDQRELDRSILELDDPRLAQRLFREPAAPAAALAATTGGAQP